MVMNLDTKPNSNQLQTSKIDEKINSIQPNQSTKFPDIYMIDKPFGHSSIDGHHDLKKSASCRLADQHKSAEDYQKQFFGGKACRHDELVKHMSNLPGYLQRAETRENIQGKALNFGVLGWERLEQWKHDEKHTPAEGKKKASSSKTTALLKTTGSSIISSTAQNKIPVPRRKLPPSHSSHCDSLHASLPRAVKKAEENINIPSLGKNPNSSSRREQHLKNYDKSSCRIQKLDRTKKEESDQMTKSELQVSFSGLRKHGSSLSSHETMSVQDDQIKTRLNEKHDLAHQYSPGKNENIVLHFPKHLSGKSCSESSRVLESRTVLDKDLMEESGIRFSDCLSSEKHHSGDLGSTIPHSCPQTATGLCKDMKQCGLVNSHLVELESIVRVLDGIPIIESEGKCREETMSNPELSIEDLKRLDEDSAQQTAVKGRSSSPHRRFSFSISKLSRSFSFKEGSSIQPLISPHPFGSGPVRSEHSENLDFTKEKATSSSRARSSPLRKLVDPLLKPKGFRNNETPLSSRGVPKYVTLKTNELLQDRKHEVSAVRALLQLTIKNGLPLFKLVVDNSSDVLVAGVRELPVTGENGSSLTYAIYKVNEIKRKSGGWINQGSKGKSSGLGYKFIGQMKLFSSSVPDITGREPTDYYVVRESVLYRVDLGQSDLETPQFIPSKELAAVVLESSSTKNAADKQSDSNVCTLKGFYESFVEDNQETSKNFNSFRATVILPGGMHGLPNKGAPSPLIDRWRSGGLCDCGGWDVGCKLHVLTNQAPSSRNSRLAISSSLPGQFNLFVLGGGQVSRPIFSMAPCKNGLYTIEFDASSISLLQAFCICVTSTSSQQSFGILEAGHKSELKLFPEPEKESQNVKTPTTPPVEVGTKYVPQPPSSPVGRV